MVIREVADWFDDSRRMARKLRSDMPSPRVSRMDSFESPVTGKSISSWRQRDRDMQSADAVDRRDIPAKAFEKRKEREKRMQEVDNG